MAIITYPLNGIDYDAENAETYLCTRTSGVYSADGNFQASVTGDRQVTISTGLAWIKNSAAAGKSVYVSEPVTVNIPMADGTRDRIDRIVLRFDKAANRSEIVVKQGDPSSAAVAPSVERTELIYELGLCAVLCKAGSTLVDIGDVTSTLLDESVCGLMRDGVTGIPTAQLQEQAEALIEELRRVITGVEDGSENMLKAVYDPKSAGIDVTVQEYTHSKSGTVHEFTGQGANGRALMTTDVESGDTFTVNGEPVSAFIADWSADKAMSGDNYSGKTISFFVGDGVMSIFGPVPGAKLVKVWENGSPQSTFTGQSLSLDLSKYDKILVEYRRSPVRDYKYQIVKKGDSGADLTAIGASNAGNPESEVLVDARQIYATDSEITFQNGRRINITKSYTEDNTVCTPITIWGILEK